LTTIKETWTYIDANEPFTVFLSDSRRPAGSALTTPKCGDLTAILRLRGVGQRHYARDPAQRFRTPNELLKAIPTITAAIDAGDRITHQKLRKTPSTASRVGTRKLPTRLGPKKISIARLPITGSDVFGREGDIGFLDSRFDLLGIRFNAAG
jgi:hypothetical protein